MDVQEWKKSRHNPKQNRSLVSWVKTLLCLFSIGFTAHWSFLVRRKWCVFQILFKWLTLFQWTQFSSIPWIVPTLGIGCATMGIYSIYLATFNYLADSYHRYASSALAAQSFCRNVLGGIFPLIATIMFNNITFQGAASLLGGIGALLTIVPWVLTIYGPTIRLRSKFASEIM